MKKRIRTNGAIAFLAVIALVAFPSLFLRPHAGVRDSLLRVAGFAMLLAGLLIRVSSRGFKSEQSKNGHALVTGGPYAVVRNPMYLGISLIGAGLVFVAFQLWVLCAFALFMALRYATLVAKEEKLLLGAFGDEYRAYQRKVPRIRPRLVALFRKGIAAALPLRVPWVNRELPSIIVLPLLGLFLSVGNEARLGRSLAHPREYFGMIAAGVLFFAGVLFLSHAYERHTK